MPAEPSAEPERRRAGAIEREHREPQVFGRDDGTPAQGHARDELQALQRENPHYTLVAAMTAMEQSHHPWRGETGQFSPAMLGKVVPKELQPIYYVAGPPGMVTGVQVMLKSTGVTNEDIRSEKFSGY